MTLENIIRAGRGDASADLAFVNARIINVFSGEILSGGFGVRDGHFTGFDPPSARQTVDLGGRFVAPGFIDAHVHIESAMASPPEFARAVAARGTTTIVADPHEIANVLGKAGLQFMLASAEGLPVNMYFTLPSCVPATDMETAGARLDAADLLPFMGHPRIAGLAEVMNFPGAMRADREILGKIRLARTHRKIVDGHAPGVSGRDLSAYVAAGVSSDHECVSADEALEKLRYGMHIMIREGTGAKNLEELVRLVGPDTAHRMMWCTDDRHAGDILAEGHIDALIRKAIRLGVAPVTAVQMATLFPATYFGLSHLGAAAPGRQADFVVFSDLNAPVAEDVYHRGRRVPSPKTPPDEGAAVEVLGFERMNVDPAGADFSIPAPSSRAWAIELVPNQIVTRKRAVDVFISNGHAEADTTNDILKIAVIERYTGKGGCGKGFIRGFGLKRGALASSVAHDAHNIIIVGAADGDMKAALSAVVSMGGGLATAADGKVLAALPLPVAGLMSFESMPVIKEKLNALDRTAKDMGCLPPDPFMTLSFLALPVIPELKITDMGLVDVAGFQIIPLFLT